MKFALATNDGSPQLANPQTGLLELLPVLEALYEDGLISAENLQILSVARANVSNGKKGTLQVIANCQWENQLQPGTRVTLDVLIDWLADRISMPSKKIDPLAVDVKSVTAVMSHAYASRFSIIALGVTATTVIIGTAEPYRTDWERELASVLKKKLIKVLVNPDDIERFLQEFYSVSRSVIGAARDQADSNAGAVQNLEQMMELGRKGQLDANDQHVVNIVDWLLQYAFEQRASDIHLEPAREHSGVRFRIDGVMHRVHDVPTAVMAAITSRIKILGRMDVAEKRRPQDGRLKTRNEEGREVELRLSTMPTAFGEKMVMRVFDPDVLLKNPADLGFSAREQSLWEGMLQAPHGIILVTGPTGSGKTTTLYTSLQQLATPQVNLCTVEDPIELIVPAFNQMQVQSNIELDFATGVRTLLRQDPDIIMIGEIRDIETAQMAIQAALTGHLVMSTLHTNDAPSAITRLLELGVPYYLLRSTIIGVIGQRLVRRICPDCTVREPIGEQQWQSLVESWDLPLPAAMHTGSGCDHCRDTGFLGRTGIYEVMQVTPQLKQAILPEADIAAIKAQAIADGMEPLRISGAHKVAEGVTTMREVVRAAPPVTDF